MSQIPPLSEIPSHPEPQKKQVNVWFWLFIALGISVVIMAGLVVVAIHTARDVARERLAQVADDAIQASTLAPPEKTDASAAVHQFLARAVENKIPIEKSDEVLRQVVQGPYGKLLELAALRVATDKSDVFSKAEKPFALEKIQTLSDAYARKLIGDDALAPVIAVLRQHTIAYYIAKFTTLPSVKAAISKDAQGPPINLEDDDITRAVQKINAVGGAYASLIRIAAIKHAVEDKKSGLAKPDQAAALAKIKALSESYGWKLVSDADLAPVLGAIPADKKGNPSPPPWKPEDVKIIMARVDALPPGYAKMARLEMLRLAIDKADKGATTGESISNFFNMQSDSSSPATIKARRDLQRLTIGYAQKAVSDQELASVLSLLPPLPVTPPAGTQPAGTHPATVPSTAPDLPTVLERIQAVTAGKEIRLNDTMGDFPDEARRLVKAMKAATAATAPTP